VDRSAYRNLRTSPDVVTELRTRSQQAKSDLRMADLVKDGKARGIFGPIAERLSTRILVLRVCYIVLLHRRDRFRRVVLNPDVQVDTCDACRHLRAVIMWRSLPDLRLYNRQLVPTVMPLKVYVLRELLTITHRSSVSASTPAYSVTRAG